MVKKYITYLVVTGGRQKNVWFPLKNRASGLWISRFVALARAKENSIESFAINEKNDHGSRSDLALSS